MRPRLARSPDNPPARAGFPLRRLLWLAAFLLPAAAAGWVVQTGRAADAALSRAAVLLERGELEQAASAVAQLRQRRRWLSPPARRQAAELAFRLGEDGAAHRFLLGLAFDAGSEEDRRLRALGARSLAAARLLARADASRNPPERARLVRQARRELPESPRLLQRLVLEELLSMTAGEGPAAEARFTAAYAELKAKAPGLAAGVRREAEQRLARQGGTL